MQDSDFAGYVVTPSGTSMETATATVRVPTITCVKGEKGENLYIFQYLGSSKGIYAFRAHYDMVAGTKLLIEAGNLNQSGKRFKDIFVRN
jgi:hypothetical protein